MMSGWSNIHCLGAVVHVTVGTRVSTYVRMTVGKAFSDTVGTVVAMAISNISVVDGMESECSLDGEGV